MQPFELLAKQGGYVCSLSWMGLYQVAFSRTQLGIKAAGTGARRMKLEFANSRIIGGSRHFRKAQQGGLGVRWNIGHQDIFENAGFPSFFKNFGVKRSTPVERNLVLYRVLLPMR